MCLQLYIAPCMRYINDDTTTDIIAQGKQAAQIMKRKHAVIYSAKNC